MSEFNMVISHNLTKDEAVKRIQKVLSEAKTKFADKVTNLKEEWSGDKANFSFRVRGFPISGKLSVSRFEVGISGNLPLALWLFRGQIKSVIRERAETLLG